MEVYFSSRWRADGAANLGIGVDKLQARDGSAAAAELKLNTTGGAVTIGSSGATTTISGNLVVAGTATTTLSETVNIKDSNILLNSDLASDTAPSPRTYIDLQTWELVPIFVFDAEPEFEVQNDEKQAPGMKADEIMKS